MTIVPKTPTKNQLTPLPVTGGAAPAAERCDSCGCSHCRRVKTVEFGVSSWCPECGALFSFTGQGGSHDRK